MNLVGDFEEVVQPLYQRINTIILVTHTHTHTVYMLNVKHTIQYQCESAII